MLKQRVITAVILALLSGVSLFVLPVEGFVLFVSLIVLLAAWEWSNLASLNTVCRSLSCVVLAGLFVIGYRYYGFDVHELRVDRLQQIFTLGVIWWVIAFLFVTTFPSTESWWRHPIAKTVMGFLVLFPAWAAFVYLRYLPHGEFIILSLVGIVTAADIGAYFSGRRFGRRKLAERVSPGKSWEGFWGGLLLVLVITTIVGLLIEGLSLVQLLIIAITTALASVLGDLLESMVKRQRGIKDSGWMLPGHGGFMDRIDSFTAAAPVFAFSLLLVLPTTISGVAH